MRIRPCHWVVLTAICGISVLLGGRFGQAAASTPRPNVILFIGDDISWNDFGCYGNPMARTPAINALAAHGMRFTRAYLAASSCSPSRASIITGRYPHNTGSGAELHQPIAWQLPWFPERLRKVGYYTALVGKNHMRRSPHADPANPPPQAFTFIDSGMSDDNHGGHARWVQTLRDRPRNAPFFCWFAAYDAHRGWDADREWDESRYGPPHDPQHVVVPPFLSDDEPTRADLASYYNEVTRFDYYIGQVVDELSRQDELENTLILVLADNGRPFPRAKTRLHDSGMQTALASALAERYRALGRRLRKLGDAPSTWHRRSSESPASMYRKPCKASVCSRCCVIHTKPYDDLRFLSTIGTTMRRMVAASVRNAFC